MDLMKQPIPETQVLSAGGTLRFALGTTTGARSNVWRIFGEEDTDDVYVAARDVLRVTKLSLHQSGVWRRALTQDAALQYLPIGVDRVLNRWEKPEPFAAGWLHAVTIIIPSSSIQRDPKPIKKLKKGGTINFYEPDPGSNQVRFDISY